MNDIENNILTIFAKDYTPGANSLSYDLQEISSVISAQINSELTTAALPSGAPSSTIYIGGHFDLNLNSSILSSALGGDFGEFQTDFNWTKNNGDGTRQPTIVGSTSNVLNYTLHSKAESGNLIDFHFDRWNGTGWTGPLHWGYDVLGGHVGHPCLDPAWH